jgi:2-dehydro-3-deoxyphosphogluconate aldolase / (4S)-4-hydroxy-2-oxoglutarate aldolase
MIVGDDRVAGIIPLLVIDDPAVISPVLDVLVDAGLTAVEVVMRTPVSLNALQLVAADGRFAPLAGTVLTSRQVDEVSEAGAVAVVSPGFDAEVSRACTVLSVEHIPGVATATEVLAARAAGVARQKLFPAESVGGHRVIRAWADAIPGVQFMPSGGVSDRNAREYLATPGVFAVSGSWLTPREELARGDIPAIKHRLNAWEGR